MEEAMKQFPHVNFEVKWRPFFLNDKLPEKGVRLADYLRAVYGNRDFSAASKHLNDAGKTVGISFKRSEDTLITPTLRSHVLVELAKQQGKEDAMMERLFKMYFEEGKILNSVDNLVAVAEEVGVKGAKEKLDDKELQAKVKEEAKEWKGSIGGVPFFIIKPPNSEKSLELEGAQPPALFSQVFRRVLGPLAAKPKAEGTL